MGYVMPEHPTVMDLFIDTIEADQRVQQRVKLDLEKVAEYAALYREGVDLGPLVAFCDGHSMILADGFHRLEAANLAGRATLPVEVHPVAVHACTSSSMANKYSMADTKQLMLVK